MKGSCKWRINVDEGLVLHWWSWEINHIYVVDNFTKPAISQNKFGHMLKMLRKSTLMKSVAWDQFITEFLCDFGILFYEIVSRKWSHDNKTYVSLIKVDEKHPKFLNFFSNNTDTKVRNFSNWFMYDQLLHFYVICE